jgi:hypothetical protein
MNRVMNLRDLEPLDLTHRTSYSGVMSKNTFIFRHYQEQLMK